MVGFCLLPVKLAVCWQGQLSQVQLGFVTGSCLRRSWDGHAGHLQRRNSPSGLEALRRLQACASSNSSPGADQIAALTDCKGLLAACIMADPAARLRWRPDDVEHATLMMHALLERPLPAAEAATDMGTTLRLQLSTSTMQWEGQWLCREATQSFVGVLQLLSAVQRTLMATCVSSSPQLCWQTAISQWHMICCR